MASLLVKARREGREIVRVTPQSAGWKYVGFAAYRLPRGESLALEADEREHCVVVLSGVVSVRSGEKVWREIGERASVFAPSSPYAVYLPYGADATIVANSAAEVAIASAPATPGDLAPRLIEPRFDAALPARPGPERTRHLRHPAADRTRAGTSGGRSADTGRPLVELPAAQA